MSDRNSAILADGLRQHDRDRYLLSLFAPASARPTLWTILALNLELARIPESVSQLVLGQMRLAWWRDAMEKALSSGETGGNPILSGLAAADAAGKLDRDSIIHLIDGSERDLLRAPDAPLTEVELDSGIIGAALTRLRLKALGFEPKEFAGAGRHFGCALGLSWLVRSIPQEAARGQLILPADLAEIAEIGPGPVIAGKADPALIQAVSVIAERIDYYLGLGRTEDTPRRAFPALGDGIVIDRYLHRLKAAGFDPFDLRLNLPDGLSAWSLSWAWLRGRY